jgi:hypothetical protein
MARGSTIPGHILTAHLPPARRKKGDGPLVHSRDIFQAKEFQGNPACSENLPVALMAGAEVDVMDSNREDDLMGDDAAMDDDNADTVPTLVPKFKSTIMVETSQLSDGGPDNTKRSFRKEFDVERNSCFASRK